MGKPEKAKSVSAAPTDSVTEKCACSGCKSTAHRFSFCTEHYEHFKFGLITKKGQPVSDYDKKIGHYQAYQESLKARKAA